MEPFPQPSLEATSEVAVEATAEAALDFLGGFLAGFVEDSHLDEIQACAHDIEVEGSEVKQAIADFEAGHTIHAIKEAKAIATTLISGLSVCSPSTMADDIQALEHWASVFAEPEKLAEIIAKRLIFGLSDITKDFASLKSDWSDKQFYAAGEDLAALISMAIGPVTSDGDDTTAGCWKQAYGRGVGKAISACPSDKEKDGALCYPLCRDGYYGVGPVCWQDCPSDFRNDGAYCYKPHSYGRGAGSVHKCDDCEKWGALWYPKCRANFHNVACCVCSPDCPDGMTDIGISCQKHSYGRTAGTPLVCEPGMEEDAALCYDPCRDGFNGEGPVCWEDCPDKTTACGALCLAEGESCTSEILDDAKLVAKAALAIVEGQAKGAIIDIAKLAGDMVYPNCPNPNNVFLSVM